MTRLFLLIFAPYFWIRFPDCWKPGLAASPKTPCHGSDLGTSVDVNRGTALASPTPGLFCVDPVPFAAPRERAELSLRTTAQLPWSLRRSSCLAIMNMSVRATWTEMEDGVLWRVDRQRGHGAARSPRASPAEPAGIQPGDVLLAIDGEAGVASADVVDGAARGVAGRNGPDLLDSPRRRAARRSSTSPSSRFPRERAALFRAGERRDLLAAGRARPSGSGARITRRRCTSSG